MFYTARLLGGFGVGDESQEVALFSESDIPWDEISFPSVASLSLDYFECRPPDRLRVHSHKAPRPSEAALSRAAAGMA